MTTWLRCTVSPGMFSNEYAVGAEQFNGKGFSLFAPKEVVFCEPPPQGDQSTAGWLRVDVYSQQGDLVLVRLPQPSLENGQYMTVRADQLQTRLQGQPVS